MSILDSISADLGHSQGRSITIGRVKKVMLGLKYTDKEYNVDYQSEKDLGAIHFEPLYSGKSGIFKGKSASRKAYPIFSFIRQYPTVGELVMIISGPSSDLNDSQERTDAWYFPPFSVFNSPHTNIFPDLREWAQFCRDKVQKPGYDLKNLDFLTMPQGKTFLEKKNIKFLRPFEGDTIIQGRWGQSIRLGSTVPELRSINLWSNSGPSGDPIVMIVNSQKPYTSVEENSPTTTEDINRDGSSIYLTSTQAISIKDIDTYPIRSWKYSSAVNEQSNNVVTIEKIPTSNEFVSAADQDEKSLNNQKNNVP
mgnify:CR=1 FL=1